MNGTGYTTAIDLINANPPMLQTMPQTWDLVGVGYFGPTGTDKKPDLLWLNKISGELAVWHMNDSSFQSAEYLVQILNGQMSAVTQTDPPRVEMKGS